MAWEAWVTLGVLGAVVVALTREVYPPSVPIVTGTVVLMVANVVTPAQAFSGFANPAPITVAALFVLARAVEKTGALQPVVAATLGRARNTTLALLRLLLPTAAVSAFINNTPIVAMLAPNVSAWARRAGESPSHYLLPVSFAAILGGMITTIGTSTNLVMSGLLESSGRAPLGMFELTAVGLPTAVVGVFLVAVLAPRVLPDRLSVGEDLSTHAREFVVRMKVVPGGPLDGKTVEEAGLRSLRGVFLVEIDRGEIIAPVAPSAVLRGEDRLVFAGRADEIVDLHDMRGLLSTEEAFFSELDSQEHTFFEAVIGPASPLVGKTLKEIRFRGQYHAAVVAIHRAGHRIPAKLGTVPLKVGDTLVLLSDAGFRDRWRDRNVFLLVARLGGTSPVANRRAGAVGLVVAAIVGGSALGLLPILHLALLGAIGLVVFRVLTPGEARASVDLDVILLIGGAFGLGAAMQTSGLAGHLAAGLTRGLGSTGDTGLLAGLVIATLGLRTVLSNIATVVLVFPVAVAAGQSVGVDVRMLAVGVVVASSASFLTPVSYQTNIMVYGLGGYRFWDYARVGIPLTIAVTVGILGIVPRVWG